MRNEPVLVTTLRATRAAIGLLDNRVAAGLPAESLARVAFGRAVGMYDQFTGALLNDRELQQQGADRIARSADIARAVYRKRQVVELTHRLSYYALA